MKDNTGNPATLAFWIRVTLFTLIMGIICAWYVKQPGTLNEDGTVKNLTQKIKEEREFTAQREKEKELKRLMPPTEFTVNIDIHMKYDSKYGGFSTTVIPGVRFTAYNNLPGQTNDQPNIGASNRKVFEGSIALSRDILRDYNVKYGDVVCIYTQGKCYIVEDTMNKRYDNKNSPGSGLRGDIFMYNREEALKVNFKSDLIVIKQM